MILPLQRYKKNAKLRYFTKNTHIKLRYFTIFNEYKLRYFTKNIFGTHQTMQLFATLSLFSP